MDRVTSDLRAAGYELRETHISRVLLGQDRVYKLKKPVQFGFLDFSSLALRKAACEAEVALNRRLAPDVYLGVVPVTRDASGHHRCNGEGQVVEWAVEMLRLADEDTAEAHLARGELTKKSLSELACLLATFHRSCRSDEFTAAFGSVARIRANVSENFEQTRHSAPAHVSDQDVREIERYQLAMLEQHSELFEARARAGYVRDGHGDLRLEHVYFRGASHGIAIIDCIEFNERFRFADVCADVAFLTMDLSWHDRSDLAEWFLAQYARHACDYGLYPLIDFYQSYRAYVRGKVASFLEEDEQALASSKARAHAQARKYYRLAQAAARPPIRTPSLYVVGGMIASGKTTVCDALASIWCCPVVDADRARKFLSGVPPEEPLPEAAFAGHYSAAATERVYAALLERATMVVASGRSVIVEASFRSRDHRRRVRQLAEQLGVPWYFVECRASDEVTRQRLARRELGPSVSDGRLALLEDLKRAWEPVDELSDREHLLIDTTQPPGNNIARIRAWVGD
ncbi:MAG: AAA family ATPase [Myxococcales bacterium]|nr:AAA family ATPase [Myxococcales bacterium]